MTVKLITSQGRCDVASQGNTLLQLMECQVRLHFVASKDCGGCWWRWWLMPGSSDGSQLVTGWCWWSVDRHQFSRHRILFTSETSERTFDRSGLFSMNQSKIHRKIIKIIKFMNLIILGHWVVSDTSFYGKLTLTPQTFAIPRKNVMGKVANFVWLFLNLSLGEIWGWELFFGQKVP